MYLKKTTQYALYAAIEMAGSRGSPVTVAQAARHYQIPETVLAKVFQQLVRSGLARGSRGVGGGYRLARAAEEITVLDIIEVYEPRADAEHCLLEDTGPKNCGMRPSCRLRQVFEYVDESARSIYASLTLEELIDDQKLELVEVMRART